LQAASGKSGKDGKSGKKPAKAARTRAPQQREMKEAAMAGAKAGPCGGPERTEGVDETSSLVDALCRPSVIGWSQVDCVALIGS